MQIPGKWHVIRATSFAADSHRNPRVWMPFPQNFSPTQAQPAPNFEEVTKLAKGLEKHDDYN